MGFFGGLLIFLAAILFVVTTLGDKPSRLWLNIGVLLSITGFVIIMAAGAVGQ